MHLTRNKTDKSVMARIMRQGKMYQKRFPLGRYKTWKAAEKEGRAWIDELKKTLPPCEMNKKGRHTHRNTSGVVGVTLAYKIARKPSGKEYGYWSWIAYWAGETKRRISIGWHIGDNYTDDEAFVLAVISREMECKDRDVVLEKYKKIKGKAKHKAILNRKLLSFE